MIKGKVDQNTLYNFSLYTLDPFIYTYQTYTTFFLMSFGDFFRKICFIVFVIGPPVVNHVDTYGEAKILRKQEAMFRFIVVLLFKSLDKYFGGSLFSSDNVT